MAVVVYCCVVVLCITKRTVSCHAMHSYRNRLRFIKGRFGDLLRLLEGLADEDGSFIHGRKTDDTNLIGKVDGILLDLGVSSPQLDTPEV